MSQILAKEIINQSPEFGKKYKGFSNFIES